jgi:DNA polymerase III epsilon subunit family exonuclease
MPLELACFVVVDLETTGLSPRRAGILEVGAVRVERLALVDRFETLVNPGARIPSGICLLTGIHDAMVARAPRAAEALSRLCAWWAEGDAAPFVAHNAPFDAGFVERGLAEHGLPALGVPVLCTRLLARRLLPELGRYGLDVLCAHFAIENRARHRALGDAEAAARVLLELLALARRAHGCVTLSDVAALGAPGTRRPRRARSSSRGGEDPLHGAVDQRMGALVEGLEANADPVG